MPNRYDVAVVGGRCGGAATAYLLAQRGYRTLLVDRATFPSDRLSTHFLQPCGVQRLIRWGLKPCLELAGAPPVWTLHLSMDDISIRGNPRTPTGEPAPGYCIRRTVLDHMMLEMASQAGADVRQECRFVSLEWQGERVVGLRTRTKHGEDVDRVAVVVGADGMRSTVAQQVNAGQYDATAPLTCMYYSYWSGLDDTSVAELYATAGLGIGIYPTNDDLTCIAVAWPFDKFTEFRADVAGGVTSSLNAITNVRDRMRGATRVERFRGTRDVPNFFRSCEGPGWALVGDAGHHKDPITGQGMSDAFEDAELLARSIDAEIAQTGRFDGTGRYEGARNASASEQHEITCRIATLSPLQSTARPFYHAIASNRSLSDSYAELAGGLSTLHRFRRICEDEGLLTGTLKPDGPAAAAVLERDDLHSQRASEAESCQ